jgi:hypothetical protein
LPQHGRHVTVDFMRSEHKTTQDEFDAFAEWRHVLTSMRRRGVRKALSRNHTASIRRRSRRR